MRDVWSTLQQINQQDVLNRNNFVIEVKYLSVSEKNLNCKTVWPFDLCKNTSLKPQRQRFAWLCICFPNPPSLPPAPPKQHQSAAASPTQLQ